MSLPETGGLPICLIELWPKNFNHPGSNGAGLSPQAEIGWVSTKESSGRCLEVKLNFFWSALERSLGTAGEFTPELWQSDVAELFLSSDGARYVELNFSPSGAWWAARFSAPRVAMQSDLSHLLRLSSEGTDSFSVVNSPESWSVKLSLSERCLKDLGINPKTLRLNACGIDCHTGRMRYWSLVELMSMKPDFHRPGEFCLLSAL